MKNSIIKLSILCLFFTSMIFSSCSKEEEESQLVDEATDTYLRLSIEGKTFNSFAYADVCENDSSSMVLSTKQSLLKHSSRVSEYDEGDYLLFYTANSTSDLTAFIFGRFGESVTGSPGVERLVDFESVDCKITSNDGVYVTGSLTAKLHSMYGYSDTTRIPFSADFKALIIESPLGCE